MLGSKQLKKAGEAHDSCRVGATQRHMFVHESNRRRVGQERIDIRAPDMTNLHIHRKSGELVTAPRHRPHRRGPSMPACGAPRRIDVAS